MWITWLSRLTFYILTFPYYFFDFFLGLWETRENFWIIIISKWTKRWPRFRWRSTWPSSGPSRPWWWELLSFFHYPLTFLSSLRREKWAARWNIFLLSASATSSNFFFSSFLSLLFFKMRSLLTVPGKHDRPGGLQGNSWQAGRGVCWRKRSRTFLPRPRQVARPWSHAGLLWPQDWSKLFTWVENKERKKRKGGTDGLKPLLCVDLEYWNCFDSFRINHRN